MGLAISNCCSNTYGNDLTEIKYEYYKNLKNSLKTGDIVLFSGLSDWSQLVKSATSSKWSHVGIIIKTDIFKETTIKTTDNNGLFLWHSTIGSDAPNIMKMYKDLIVRGSLVQESITDGVQLNDLYTALNNYEGLVCIRRLNISYIKSAEIDTALRNKVIYWMLEESGKPYEQNIFHMTETFGLDHYGNEFIPYNSYFCSELAIETFKKLNIIHPSYRSQTFSPQHFSTESEDVNEILKTNSSDISLGDEITILM